MANTLSHFIKRRSFLVCVDSDGCALDTMDIKHSRCFGPCIIREWGLEPWRDELLTRWNEINLYTRTRGINRFQALAIMLAEVHEKYCEIQDLDSLAQWVNDSPEPTISELTRSAEATDSICLKKALAWSESVNQSVSLLALEDKRPFEGVRRALARTHRYADVAVLSNANLQTVLDEWDFYGLLEYTDIVLAQDDGGKSRCIRELLKTGYENNRVLLCGDAPDDLAAARENHIFYYPVLVGHECESWTEFLSEGFERLRNGTYAGRYQQQKIDMFLKNLDK